MPSTNWEELVEESEHKLASRRELQQKESVNKSIGTLLQFISCADLAQNDLIKLSSSIYADFLFRSMLFDAYGVYIMLRYCYYDSAFSLLRSLKEHSYIFNYLVDQPHELEKLNDLIDRQDKTLDRHLEVVFDKAKKLAFKDDKQKELYNYLSNCYTHPHLTDSVYPDTGYDKEGETDAARICYSSLTASIADYCILKELESGVTPSFDYFLDLYLAYCDSPMRIEQGIIDNAYEEHKKTSPAIPVLERALVDSYWLSLAQLRYLREVKRIKGKVSFLETYYLARSIERTQAAYILTRHMCYRQAGLLLRDILEIDFFLFGAEKCAELSTLETEIIKMLKRDPSIKTETIKNGLDKIRVAGKKICENHYSETADHYTNLTVFFVHPKRINPINIYFIQNSDADTFLANELSSLPKVAAELFKNKKECQSTEIQRILRPILMMP
jgi:hypothetical protein